MGRGYLRLPLLGAFGRVSLDVLPQRAGIGVALGASRDLTGVRLLWTKHHTRVLNDRLMHAMEKKYVHKYELSHSLSRCCSIYSSAVY